LQFAPGESAADLGLKGSETFSVEMPDTLAPGQLLTVTATADDGTVKSFKTQSRIDTPIEIEYCRDGGILRTVLKKLLGH
jgi:aconitate hydratase